MASPAVAQPRVELRILDERLSQGELLPEYATAGSAGLDLRACIDEPVTIGPGATALLPAGIALHLEDPNLCAVMAPRSGLGIKHGIVLSNLIGVIDADYTGGIVAAAWNRSDTPFVVEPMMRICQLLIVPVVRPIFEVVKSFSRPSARSGNGFGSTGLT